MKKNLSLLVFLFISSLFSNTFDYKNIPIQENGRIKPLDTFAKNQLLRISGKRTLSDSDLSSADWLFGVLIGDPKGRCTAITQEDGPVHFVTLEPRLGATPHECEDVAAEEHRHRPEARLEVATERQRERVRVVHRRSRRRVARRL